MEYAIRSVSEDTCYKCDAGSMKGAVEKAVANGADLSGANLRGASLFGANLSGADLFGADLRDADLRDADLSGADLRDADLRGADLSDANLFGADLRDANLRGADLSGADLSGANLRGANLFGADLRDADLSGATINWQSHDLISELLLRAAGDDIARRKVAGLILVSRDWCWGKFLAIESGQIESGQHEWALSVLRQYVKDGDDAPEILKGGVKLATRTRCIAIPGRKRKPNETAIM